MDALRRHDIQLAQKTAEGEKLKQALELMELGLAMKRRQLRAKDPTATDDEIDDRLVAWMSAPR